MKQGKGEVIRLSPKAAVLGLTHKAALLQRHIRPSFIWDRELV